MQTKKIKVLPMALILVLTGIGCEKSENQRLADMAEKHLDRQTEQNRQMTELQREVAEGSRHLVESDAKAREEMIGLQREVQTERVEMGQQRDALDAERRELATGRRVAPIIATAITNIGLLLACILPLVLCWYLLHRPNEPVDDQVVVEVLLDDLVAHEPQLPRPENHRVLGVCDQDDDK